MSTAERRYDIDWLRVIAIAFLLIYHVVIVFQPWGFYIGFIQSSDTSDAIWIPMAMLNVWRIPLLFFVSGMGVCFSLRRRDWKQLLLERGRRILIPLIFGSFLIVPIHIFIFQVYYGKKVVYSPGVGHLWFLLNICIYVIQMIGFAFLDKKYDYKFFNFFRKLLKRPYFIYLFLFPFIIEAELLNPQFFSLYVGTTHGFIVGMMAFFFGFFFIAIGDSFWKAVEKMKIISFLIAGSLYLIRLIYFDLNAPNYLTSIESMNWIFAVMGFGYKYFNKPSKILSYLSQAAYPVYIIHMIFLYLAAYLILPFGLELGVNILLIVLFTFAGCYITYELLVKRISFIRPLFGLKRK
ncbi:MAG: acyltransferase [Ignavibacteria bacterium]|nr:acyltransferase [Ignavibacteria bacterium]MBT8383495.1 acyltransferase [Ignavibacteria bacterium]MBT8393093.1 acyltransferase [Ignavibacteria bacterium]NNJ52144.1 acyltransferase [Ignavibacteriaceae bacterium]NNL21897.1 acyltransferase [Ignavibacteriaceae bacterium]